MRVYLAGPEVFREDRDVIISMKKELAQEYGFSLAEITADPEDKELATKFERGLGIGQLNEQLIEKSDLMIANLTPFRGVSADVGTVYEVGLMRGLGKPVFGYSTSDKSFLARTSAHYRGRVFSQGDHVRSASDGQFLEDFEMNDNLMIDGGIIRSGGVFVTGFRQEDPLWAYKRCLVEARTLLNVGVS